MKNVKQELKKITVEFLKQHSNFVDNRLIDKYFENDSPDILSSLQTICERGIVEAAKNNRFDVVIMLLDPFDDSKKQEILNLISSMTFSAAAMRGYIEFMNKFSKLISDPDKISEMSNNAFRVAQSRAVIDVLLELQKDPTERKKLIDKNIHEILRYTSNVSVVNKMFELTPQWIEKFKMIKANNYGIFRSQFVSEEYKAAIAAEIGSHYIVGQQLSIDDHEKFRVYQKHPQALIDLGKKIQNLKNVNWRDLNIEETRYIIREMLPFLLVSKDFHKNFSNDKDKFLETNLISHILNYAVALASPMDQYRKMQIANSAKYVGVLKGSDINKQHEPILSNLDEEQKTILQEEKTEQSIRQKLGFFDRLKISISKPKLLMNLAERRWFSEEIIEFRAFAKSILPLIKTCKDFTKIQDQSDFSKHLFDEYIMGNIVKKSGDEKSKLSDERKLELFNIIKLKANKEPVESFASRVEKERNSNLALTL